MVNLTGWTFDQAPNVACICNQAVLDGAPVLIVTHYEDDHCWAFLDGEPVDPADAMVVAMSTVLRVHPELKDIADLTPGWTAFRQGPAESWSLRREKQ